MIEPSQTMTSHLIQCYKQQSSSVCTMHKNRKKNEMKIREVIVLIGYNAVLI